MNVERIRQLADHIEGLERYTDIYSASPEEMRKREMPEGFNMCDWISKADCGTVGCIAGHAACLFREQDDRTSSTYYGIKSEAKRALGISERQAQNLFVPNMLTCSLACITPAMAAQTLRLVADGIPPLVAWATVLPSEMTS